MFLVTGATGGVGRHVVGGLLARGAPVRAMTRTPQSAELPGDADVVGGDLADPDGWEVALRDVRAVYLFPHGDTAGFLAEAKRAGVQRVVTLSAHAVTAAAAGTIGADNVIAESHLAVEQAVQDSGLAWTHLRPTAFASNTLHWAHSIRAEGAVRVPYGESAMPVVHEADIAAVAIRALCDNNHAGVVYDLTGPEVVTQRQQAELIGDAIERPVEFTDLDPDIAGEAMISAGMPETLVHSMLELQASALDAPHAISDAVQRVTGVGPLSFARWAADNADAFRP